jgi:mono/diheme cytochrome c family protein
MKLPKTLSTVLVVALVEIVLGTAAFFIIIYSGAYDVAATEPHSGTTVWVLSTTMDHSVRRHAAGIPVSETYQSPDLAEGYEHYNGMCVSCHGAPGVIRSEAGQGLNPSAPDLSEAAGDWTPSEVYWITKNGVKMSGMPAFGLTHDEEKLWNITAFVKRLPGMSVPQYQEMGKASGSAEHSHPESK